MSEVVNEKLPGGSRGELALFALGGPTIDVWSGCSLDVNLSRSVWCDLWGGIVCGSNERGVMIHSTFQFHATVYYAAHFVTLCSS